MASGYVENIVSANSFNTCYLEYPDGDIDTLYIEVGNLGPKEGTKDRCNCEHPFTVVMFNGQYASESSTLSSGTGKPVYIFAK